MTALDIITDALQEIGALAQGETPRAEDADFALRKLNRLMDRWAARDIMAFNVGFSLFTLTPNHSPHTIGPSAADWAVTQRPVRIESAQWVLGAGSSAVDVPINIRDDDWWANQRVKALGSSISTDLYYSPDWPNGSCFFWPIPQTAAQVRLELWGLLGSFPEQTTVFTLPPGYWDAVINNLALALAPAFQAPVSPDLREQARLGLSAIQGNNSDGPRIETAAAGMPRSGGNRAGFNFLTGGVNPR